MPSQVKASVIIPTYNGGRKIPGLLQALANQTSKDFEIIVVVDGSTDNTVDVVEEYRSNFPGFHVIRQTRGGRSAARNNGAQKASADLLIFYDDDMNPFSDSVERHIKFHHQNFGLLCGDPVEYFDKNKTDIQNYKAWLTSRWTRQYADAVTMMGLDRLFFTASNCSIPRTIFRQLDGFSKDLTDVEDFELAHRAIRRGIPVFYDKTNKALHNESITCKSYIRRLREYSEARKKLADNEKSVQQRNWRSALKRLIYTTFASAIWVRLIDAGFFRIAPKPVRYRFYSIVIHALANEHGRVVL